MQLVAVQLDIAWENRPANRRQVRTLLQQQIVEPDALIVLPEMFDTGFSMNVDQTAAPDAVDSEKYLQDLARDYRSFVLAGVTGRDADRRPVNQAVALGPDGHELARYRKMRLFTPSGEHEKYVPGTSHQLFAWRNILVSPFICYDLRFPELFRPAARDGAQLMVVIASWPARRSEHWFRLLQARAIENQAYVVGVNRCGQDPAVSYPGRSAAFDPLGEVLFEADATPGVWTCSIESERVESWRKTFPALRDMR